MWGWRRATISKEHHRLSNVWCSEQHYFILNHFDQIFDQALYDQYFIKCYQPFTQSSPCILLYIHINHTDGFYFSCMVARKWYFTGKIHNMFNFQVQITWSMADLQQDWQNLWLKDHKYKGSSTCLGRINNWYWLSHMYVIVLEGERVPTNKFGWPGSGDLIYWNAWKLAFSS